MVPLGQRPRTLFGRLGPEAKKENLYIHNLGTQSVRESSILGQPIWDWVIV